MPSYSTGSVKISTDGKAVAIRTIFPDTADFIDRQWGVMTSNNGGHYVSNDAVADWPDAVQDPDWNNPTPPTP